MRSILRPLSLLAVAIVAAACSGAGSGPDTPISDGDPPTGVPAPEATFVIADGHADGPGTSIADAIAQRGSGEDLLVNGSLFVGGDGSVRLCSAIAESFPPQCGGERLLVEGLDLATVDDLQEANGVRWADSVALFGRVAGDP